ncbi:MAG TPA: LuxR C-terminal-related transcriptional regulator [Nocardioidaceae bacterium]|nr:LuxR C-terminal-related transcriptional regulator [Nocardioidaceae bacterium]
MAVVEIPKGGSLPASVDSFVGRRQELTEARRLASGTRLLTITGVGGVGKTRLALKLAADMRRVIADGVFLVELASLRDSGLLANTIASSLGLQEQTSRWQVGPLIEHIADRELLLVLDNCEHLADACAVLVDALMRECQQLRVIATSREPLRVAGESVLSLAPLPVPDPEAVPRSDALVQYDAVTLFLDRADAAQPGFSLTEQNHVVVARLCSRLEGLPLALELAAVRLRVLSVEEILARLDDRFAVLGSGARAGHDRQRTLRACIDWSFDLCSAQEQQLWARLSVFPGVFDLAAAEGVCVGDPIDRGDVLELVASLVEKSILQRERTTGDGGFRMLESLRQYGESRLLGSGEAAAVAVRHRDWYADLVAAAGREWISPTQSAWIARLHANHASLRAVLELCAEDPSSAVIGLRMASTLEPYWTVQGLLAEAEHWLDKLLAAAEQEADPADIARALRIKVWFGMLKGDLTTAERLLGQAVQAASRTELPDVRGGVALASGQFALRTGDPATAMKHLEEALAGFRAAQDRYGEASTLFFLGLAYGLAQEPAAAAQWLEEARALTSAQDEKFWQSMSVWGLALLDAFPSGDNQRAAELCRESILLARDIGGQGLLGMGLQSMAVLAAASQEYLRAATLSGAADRQWKRLGASWEAFEGLYAVQQIFEAQVRQGLGEQKYKTAFQRGSALELDEAVSLALSETPSDGAAARPADDKSVLTRREREVAELVGEGLSNRDIARRLVISQRTAEGHVEKILSKLGFTNRAQIAAWIGTAPRA